MLIVTLAGCSGGTDWRPVADQVCKKYGERLQILKRVGNKLDAAEQQSRIKQNANEYEELNDKLLAAMLRLRDSGGSLDYQRLDEFKKQWATTHELVIVELRRLNSMNGAGPDYDLSLGEFTRIGYNNPFR